MKILKSVIVALVLCSGFYCYADSKVTTSIEGVDSGKELVKMTFNESVVTLTFSDLTTIEADMDIVRVTLDHSTSAIDKILADPDKIKGIYNLKGQYLGESTDNLSPGIYIINGQKIVVK